MTTVPTKEKTKTDQSTQDDKTWYLMDAEDKVLGRLATRITIILMGKNKPFWQPHLDQGDWVIIVNAKKVRVTGNKEEDKTYYRYSGYPGGLKEETLKHLRERKPEDIIHEAVKGMLPKSRLGRAMIKKLFIYPGEQHPHEAQKPQGLEV
jgi:large subunit ribosomal protein L13